jgi:hypothetical protein
MKAAADGGKGGSAIRQQPITAKSTSRSIAQIYHELCYQATITESVLQQKRGGYVMLPPPISTAHLGGAE